MARTAALCVALLLAAAAQLAAAADKCSQIPYVPGVDQSPTDPANYGLCTGALESGFSGTNWCRAGPIGLWPAPPTDKAQKCLKFGRATIYRGPIYGSSPNHFAACDKRLVGSDEAAMVAVSTKYLTTTQGGWAADKGACDKCMCVRLHGGDDKFNQGIQKKNAKKHIGLTFLAKVGDRCSECDDDHIDLLQDRPLTFAPFRPDNEQDNFNAPYVNAKDGLRGFTDPKDMRSTDMSMENVGAWTADWQWVPCSTTHDQCGTLMRSMGYSDVFTPKRVDGVDSFSLRPISQLRKAGGGPNYDRLFKEPWSK